MTITIIGAGAFGTALACVWARDGTRVDLVAREGGEGVQASRENVRRLPGIRLPDSVFVTDSPDSARRAPIVAIATPAQTVAGVLRGLDPTGTVVLCAKGIDAATGRLLTQEAPHAAILSGPGFAAEIASGCPTAMTLAGADAARLCATLSRPRFRLYASSDTIGVAAGGALKNVAAIAVGVARALGLGASAEAALVTRAQAEIAHLGVALGGKVETFYGLSGMGDLVLTCGSTQSRNFAYGEALARGQDLSDRPLAEGAKSAAVASRLARRHAIEVPIMDAVTALLDGTLASADVIAALMERPLKPEGKIE